MKFAAQMQSKRFWGLGVLAATVGLCGAVWLELSSLYLLEYLKFTARYMVFFCVIVQLTLELVVYYQFSRFIPNTTWFYRLLQLAMFLGHVGSLVLWLVLLAVIMFVQRW
jgi:hypothetical protein